MGHLLTLPLRFVWVTEISDIDVCKLGKFNGLLIYDSTNPMTDIQNVLWAQYDGFYYIYDKEDLTEKRIMKKSLSQELNQSDWDLR